MKYQCDQSGISITLKSEADPLVTGDPNRLHQLFLNIVLNSLQAMPAGGEIAIECNKLEGEHEEWLRVQVIDNGEGIPQENLKKVFDPFFSTKTHGTGLGLATARAIMTEHDGRIAVKSASGNGTTLILDFPSAGPSA
jgi:signal transduction histidine kinase